MKTSRTPNVRLKRASAPLAALLALALLAACGGKAVPEGQATDPSGAGSSSGIAAGSSPTGGSDGAGTGIRSLDFASFPTVEYRGVGSPDALVMPGSIRHKAHASYLADPSTMVPVPVKIPASGTPAVVGSRVAKLWPASFAGATADLVEAAGGAPLPIGAVLSLGERIECPDRAYDGLYKLGDHWNWFYPASYAGKTGIVFGADLVGLRDRDPRGERLAVAAWRYQTEGRYGSFHALRGLDPLSSGVAARLERDRVAFSPVEWGEALSDEMLGLYQAEAKDAQRPVFVTTDLAAHVIHLAFDKYLQRVEEDYFAPRLAALIDAFLVKLDALEAADDGSVPEYGRTLAIARQYFLVPRALLEATPAFTVDDRGRREYAEADLEAVYGTYPEAVRETLALIEAHEGWGKDPLILYDEDFSQYKPRGHYTRNAALGQYFKAMMWFGRIHAYMALRGGQSYVWANGDPEAPKTATGLSLRLTPMAVLLNRLALEDPSLVAAWRELFDPITYLIGVSDDLSLDDVMPFVRKNPVAAFPAWTADEDAVKDFVRKAAAELRPPRVAGNSVVFVPSGEGDTPPLGWRLFGQRFTWDSAVHMATSFPRLPPNDEMIPRYWVSGLDLMKAFGSKTADALLSRWENGYATFPGLEGVLDGFESEFSGRDEAFWAETYYNRALFLIKAQAQFEPGAGFYFTETPAWGAKALLSAHGTWAELRHDTILYVKQVYGAEMSGGGDWEPTWRVEPIPEPIHYVEPNLPFWTGVRILVRDLAENAARMGLLPESYANAFETLEAVLAEAVDIVRLEVEDKPISEVQNEAIRRMARRLVPASNPENPWSEELYSGGEPQDERMGIIADVYTAVEPAQVLEVGIAAPYRIEVLLNDGQGGKRVAAGYVFSYYEFRHPMDDRLTDEQWKEIAYRRGADLAKYRPFWSEGIFD